MNTPTPNQPYSPTLMMKSTCLSCSSRFGRKILIVLVTAVVTVLALIYALTATNYQTQATLPHRLMPFKVITKGAWKRFVRLVRKEKMVRMVTQLKLLQSMIFLRFIYKFKLLQLRNSFEEVYLPSSALSNKK